MVGSLPPAAKASGSPAALLAVLAIRPWSAYELAGYMRNSTLRAIWPRAESRIYAEVKRLEKLELRLMDKLRLTQATQLEAYGHLTNSLEFDPAGGVPTAELALMMPVSRRPGTAGSRLW